MSIEEKLKAVPGSYDDFVNDIMRWIRRDSNIEVLIENQFISKPDSTTDDLTLVLWDYLGVGKPIEIVDDDEKKKKKVSVAML